MTAQTPLTYRDAGVDIDAGNEVVERIKPLVKRTFRPEVMGGLGGFGALGLYIQTGAWERSNKQNMGVTWLAWRYISCYTNPSQLKEFMPDIQTNGNYNGWSVGWGVEITRLVNIKVLYYKYTKPPEIDYSVPIYQFSFNYSLK